MWIENPKVQLVIEDVLNKFDPQLVKSNNKKNKFFQQNLLL